MQIRAQIFNKTKQMQFYTMLNHTRVNIFFYKKKNKKCKQ